MNDSLRLVKFLIVAVVLTFSGKILLSKVTPSRRRDSTTLNPISQELYRVISPETYHYVFNQSHVCVERSPFLVLIVPVAPGDRDSRDAIRKTWGSKNLIPNMDILTMFFLGMPKEGLRSNIQASLRKESQDHADIIQMDFLDSYQNLTIKTMMVMNWLATHCQTASYAMKVDTDIFVNVFYLVNHMLRDSPRHEFITGSVITDGRPRRNKKSKWYLSEDIYPEDTFPPYVSGAGYVFSMDLAREISWASRFVKMIPLEDVYVGLCLRVAGVRLVYSQSYLTLKNLFEIRRLEYNRCTYATRVIVTGFKPQELLHIWHDFHKGHLTC
ncbi:beta-1,3-galactosyltransferase 2 [Osmerus mordax]|uniref:beta-1,3-galactosyltransferase 2 n=1 Tax=Osmerus mordax TaxID=8014 RepID=UPI00350F88C6